MAETENEFQADQEDPVTDFDADALQVPDPEPEQETEGGDGDTAAVTGTDETSEDPELEAIKARVREMEEEAVKLKEMQSEVDKWMNTPTTPPAAAGFPSIDEKIDADGRSVYVGNVDYGTTAEELEQHFHGCGSVNRVTILCDKFTGHPKGFAYIEFADKDSVATATALDESLFRGRQIKVGAKRTNRPGISTTNRPRRSRRGGGFRPSPYGYSPRPRGRFNRFRRATYYSPY